MNDDRPRKQARHGRRGDVFSVRLTDAERAELERRQAEGGGPRSIGPWLVWAALRDRGGSTPTSSNEKPWQPRRRGNAGSSSAVVVVPRRGAWDGNTPTDERLVLDLCAGSGSWSEPYRAAGYRVVRVSLPEVDVRTFQAPRRVWGILAAPPCNEFSMAKRDERDFVRGMECVNACLRIVLQARPRWWALENPVGYLARYLGPANDCFEPCDFGDPWTKRTALWGDFVLPTRGPFVEPRGGGPLCTVCDPERRKTTWCSNSDHRAVTPPGFAKAFFLANP
jgi:hypothetical protein